MIKSIRSVTVVAACLCGLSTAAVAKRGDGGGAIQGKWTGTMQGTGRMNMGPGTPDAPLPPVSHRRTFAIKQAGRTLHLSTTHHGGGSAGQDVVSSTQGRILSNQMRSGDRVLTVKFGGKAYAQTQEEVLRQGPGPFAAALRVGSAEATLVLTIRKDGRLGFDGSGTVKMDGPTPPAVAERLPGAPAMLPFVIKTQIIGVLDAEP